MNHSHAPQGAETEYVRWSAPDCPPILLRRRVLDGIHAEAQHGLSSVPKRGAEIGGLLLGARRGDEILIDDFEPIPCEHRFGPSYQLSKTDLQVLDETLLWARQQGPPALAVVGFYRSHTRDEFVLGSPDRQLFSTYFPEPGQVLLLIKPGRLQPTVADFFLWRDGELRAAFRPVTFPFNGAAEIIDRPQPEPAAEQKATHAVPAPPAPEPPGAPAVEPRGTRARPAPPVPEPKRTPRPQPAPPPPAPAPPPLVEEPEDRPRRTWPYLVVLLAGLAGLLWYGYPAVVSEPPPPPPVVRLATPQPLEIFEPNQAAAAEPPQEPAAPEEPPPPEPAPPPLKPPEAAGHPRAARVPSEPPVPEAVRSVLARWAKAIGRGDIEAATRDYMPQLAAQKRWELHRMLARYGRLAVNRISEVSVVPEGRDEAVVTFRRHWETKGGAKHARETEERLRLIRTRTGWKIASEQEVRVYWTYGR